MIDKSLNNFGQRLQKIRKSKGLNQTELSKKLKLPQSSISHFEGNRRSPCLSNLKKLADALHVSADYLIGRTDNPDEYQEADGLYKDFKKLSDEQRQYAEIFMKGLSENN